MSFADKLKAKASQLNLDTKAQQAKEKAAVLAENNRDKIAGAVGKAGQTIDAKTGGKHSDKIRKAQDAALKGVDKVAQQGSAPSPAVESPIDRAVGADAGVAAYQSSENPVERAIGADATSVDMGRNDAR